MGGTALAALGKGVGDSLSQGFHVDVLFATPFEGRVERRKTTAFAEALLLQISK